MSVFKRLFLLIKSSKATLPHPKGWETFCYLFKREFLPSWAGSYFVCEDILKISYYSFGWQCLLEFGWKVCGNPKNTVNRCREQFYSEEQKMWCLLQGTDTEMLFYQQLRVIRDSNSLCELKRVLRCNISPYFFQPTAGSKTEWKTKKWNLAI